MKKDWPKKPNKTDLTMSRNIVHNLLLIFCFAALTISCIDNVNDLNNWGNDQAINDLSGNYHFLEEEGIKIFLPENFNRINNYDLKKYADSIGKNYDYSFKIHQPKEALYKAMDFGRRAGLDMAKLIYDKVYASEDAIEGPRAFAEKRKPIWK